MYNSSVPQSHTQWNVKVNYIKVKIVPLHLKLFTYLQYKKKQQVKNYNVHHKKIKHNRNVTVRGVPAYTQSTQLRTLIFECQKIKKS